MSVVIGGGSTSARESRWIILAMLIVILIANHAFGSIPPQRIAKPLVRQPRPERIVRTCRVDAQGVPRCVVLGTFPTNPAWQQR
jgi:hypothetical protein